MNIVVIGGGAAGFFGAIACAEANPKARVAILEKGAHVLTKVRISGGGRCNVTHSCFDPKVLVKNYPRGGQALLGPFNKFHPKNTIEWFESRGAMLKTEADGRLFPITDASITIVNTLRDAADKANVDVKTHSGPASIEMVGPSKFKVTKMDGESAVCDRVLLACGSSPQGYQWARELGHTIESPVPSLFTFAVPDERLRGLAGIAVEKAEVSIVGTKLKQSGPVLITHWGLSGPAVLKLSAWGARVLHDVGYQAQIKINWLSMAQEDIEKKLEEFKAANHKKTVSAHCPFGLPHRLWERLAQSIGMKDDLRWADLSKVQIRRLAETLCNNVYRITGKSTFKEEFVTCGGVKLDEVDFRTMESRKCPGLYFAGEILDIDGVTGGFNFQSAWTTSWLAGRAMAVVS